MKRNFALATLFGAILYSNANAAPAAVAAPASPFAARIEAAEATRLKGQVEFLLNFGVNPSDLNRPWQIFLAGLERKLNFDDSKHVQLVASPQPADWNSSDPQVNTWRMSNYGDAMPKWGAIWDPQTGSSFAETYGSFLDAIALTPPDPADASKAQGARRAWDSCLVNLRQVNSLVGPHWKEFDDQQRGLPVARRMSFDTWYGKYDGQILGNLQADCTRDAQAYFSYYNHATAGARTVTNALARLGSLSATVDAKVPDTDRIEAVYPYAVVQSLSDFVAASKQAPGLAWDQTFTKDSGTYDKTETTWGGGASYGWFFHASAGGASTNIDTHSDQFSMTVQIKGLQTFDIRPGSWFSQTVVQQYADGPFVTGSKIRQLDDNKQLYGRGGLFSLRTSRFVVAYQPKVILKMEAHDYQLAKSQWSGGGGFGIGPFNFDASASHAATHISWDDATNTLTAQDSSDVPQIIAVILDVLPDFR